MRKLLIGVIILAAAWSGYWFFAQSNLDKLETAWLESKAAEGWDITFDERRIIGFPNRLDTYFENLSITSPDKIWRWYAPEFEAFTLVYKPNHIIFVWPDTQTLTIDGEESQLAAEDLRASLIIDGATGNLDRFVLEGSDLAMSFRYDPTIYVAENINLAVRQTPEKNDLQIVTSVNGFKANGILANDLPGSNASADVTYHLNQPLQSNLPIGTMAGKVEGMTIANSQMNWNGLNVSITGDLNRGYAGFVEGGIDMNITGWKDAISTLQSHSDKDTKEIGNLLSVMAAFLGGADALNLPIKFEDGVMYIREMPISAAPKLN